MPNTDLQRPGWAPAVGAATCLPDPAAVIIGTSPVTGRAASIENGTDVKTRRNEDTAPEEHEEVKAAPPIDDRREKRMLAWRQAAAAAAAAAAAQTAAPREGGDRSALQVPLGRPSSGTGASTSPRRGWNLEDEASASEDEGDSGQRAQEAATLASNGGEEGPQRGALGTTNHAPAAAGADDDEEIDPLDAFMAQNDAALASTTLEPTSPTAGAPPDEGKEGDNEVDPLDAFMAGDAFQRDLLPTQATATTATPPAPGATPASAPSRPTGSEAGSDSDASGDGLDEEDEDEDDAEWMRKLQAGKLSKGDRLAPADHASIAYAPFRRNFYREPEALARLGEEEAGLSGRLYELLRRDGFEAPLPIQAQALPAIMSGRDTIGIAKTGSGKTLAYVLPLLRHVKDQPPLALGEGPIALVMAPTRELVSQITREVRRFGKPLGVRATAVYGGSGVANQISELKRGSEAVVCTPGRMIDILVTSGGKITNLRRVTYLVLDEADRMFDMGFEPQIARIVNNIRPDRQTVMFSATFPRQVEGLARALLADPVEIQVGGRSVVNADIAQFVELRAEEDRLWRLLELLGEWYERGKLLVFVASQERCDNLFRDLLRHGYPCLSLHGGKDQSDRESTISDFKSDVCNILIATSGD
ncbi:DEAD-box ATP-dependent RNA helicase 42 [Auxenochlorella protothecoides]|uniref:RNA helicase n=1 Tax=Auxenochlorella protothecoides TaxID=3075 RepID=A0A087SKZ7_AUXPR|nr:DEAD-box ATP-dependent RNA helicase 42 [Auxenochlorella protothecoides]KFM26401.1 DEAD-box ATP-dependent RNA helicase 42 [Auxenochlorella protothecoides]